MCCGNKAMPIHSIDGKCHHIKQLNAGKSCKTCLANHTTSILHYIMSLVSNALGGGHKDTQAHIPTHKQKQFQQKSGARGPAPVAHAHLV